MLDPAGVTGMMAPMERLAQIEQLASEFITEHGLGKNHENLVALHDAIYRGTCEQEIADHAHPETREGERVKDDPIYVGHTPDCAKDDCQGGPDA